MIKVVRCHAVVCTLPRSKSEGSSHLSGSAWQLDIVEDIATCELCGCQGIYGSRFTKGVEIVDADYIDCTGHDSVRSECRDVEACLNRRGY